MEIDVARVLGLVTRSVRNFEKDGKAASAVTLTRLYDTSVDDLWDAVTSKERIPRWFLPVEGDLQLGGRYQLKGNAGGTITACTPPDHFRDTKNSYAAVPLPSSRCRPMSTSSTGRCR